MGKVVKEIRKVAGDRAYTSIMGYDEMGKITNIIYPDGENEV